MNTVIHPVSDEARPKEVIRTTLYDLIAALNSEVGPEEDALVVATMMHLIQSGRVKFLKETEHVN